MKRYEYRHVRMAYSFLSCFSKEAFHRQLTEHLQRMGDEGWELKSAIHEGFGQMHVHLLFGREIEGTR